MTASAQEQHLFKHQRKAAHRSEKWPAVQPRQGQ